MKKLILSFIIVCIMGAYTFEKMRRKVAIRQAAIGEDSGWRTKGNSSSIDYATTITNSTTLWVPGYEARITSYRRLIVQSGCQDNLIEMFEDGRIRISPMIKGKSLRKSLREWTRAADKGDPEASELLTAYASYFKCKGE